MIKYRCKFEFDIPSGTFSTPEQQNKWLDAMANPPDGGKPICPLAYKLCHSPCDALGMRTEHMVEEIQGIPN